MKRKHNIIGILIVTGLFIAGCAASFFVGYRNGERAGGQAGGAAEAQRLERHLNDQFGNAGCEGVKTALLDGLQYLERYRNVGDGGISETVYYGDKMLLNIRLARVEAFLGNEPGMRERLDSARAACMKRNQKDCSDKNLLIISDRLQASMPIACLENMQ